MLRTADLKLIPRVIQLCSCMPKLVLEPCPHQIQGGNLFTGCRQILSYHGQLVLKQKLQVFKRF